MFGETLGRHGTAATTIFVSQPGLVWRRLRGVSLRLAWQPDLSRDAMFLLGILVGLAQASGGFAAPTDAVMYWESGTSTNIYPQTWAGIAGGQLPYPPPLAQISALLQPIGWPAFILLLTATIFAAFWYCAREWSLPLIVVGIPWFLGIGPEEPAKFLAYALIGNLQWILAALTVMALRHPSLWSLELVTKITTAAGWWWYVLRGEWRKAAIGAVAALAVVAVSVAFGPALWADYIGFAIRNLTAEPPIPTFPIPLVVRLVTAVPLMIWGARANRAWVVPVVCGWSLVGMYSFSFLPFFVAAWRVWADGAAERRPRPSA